MIKLITEQIVKNMPKNFTGIIEWPEKTKRWFVEGKKHRLDGPAVEHPNGTVEYYLYDKRCSLEKWQKELAKLNDPNHNKIIDIEGKKYKLTLVE